MGGVFGGAEAIPVVETTTRSLRNVPKGKELVHQTAEKRGKNPENQRFPDSQTLVVCHTQATHTGIAGAHPTPGQTQSWLQFHWETAGNS